LKKSTSDPTQSLEATWTKPSENDENVKYKLRLDKVISQTKKGSDKEATNSNNSYTFDQLTPGGGYKVYVWAVAGDSAATSRKESDKESNTSPFYTGMCCLEYHKYNLKIFVSHYTILVRI